MLTKDMAICIRAIDYSETSQIAVFFTKEHGKISAIAKGSKRPKSLFGGPIEIFSYGKIVFTDSDRDKLATLTEIEYDESNTSGAGLYKNIFALNCCFLASELLTKLTDDYDPHPGLFDSFLLFLQNAKEQQNNSQILTLLIYFQLTLLKEAGLQPVLRCCANCKTSYEPRVTSHESYFSSTANGLICRDCEMSFPDKIRLSKQASNCLTNVKLLAQAKEQTLREIEKIFIIHFTNILGHQLKMAKHFLSSGT
jgi:DNA repair protein RecO (recombination protein O)